VKNESDLRLVAAIRRAAAAFKLTERKGN
jgi:hypothetical protein